MNELNSYYDNVSRNYQKSNFSKFVINDSFVKKYVW